MDCRQSSIVGSSGTSSPRLEYSMKTRPILLSIVRLRKTSPQAQWKKLGMVPRIFPWVPFPAPGAPNRSIVRYFMQFLILDFSNPERNSYETYAQTPRPDKEIPLLRPRLRTTRRPHDCVRFGFQISFGFRISAFGFALDCSVF